MSKLPAVKIISTSNERRAMYLNGKKISEDDVYHTWTANDILTLLEENEIIQFQHEQTELQFPNNINW